MLCLSRSSKVTPLFVFFSVVLFAASLLPAGCQAPQMHRQTRLMMGTYIEVVSDDSRAAAIVFDEFARVEKLLSKYDPASEISRLNRDGRLKVSPETWYILTRAREFWLASGGAFDVTVGPLMDIWGFTDKDFRVPSEEDIAAARRRVGMEKLVFHQDDNVVELSVSGMEIDLGAIAKGYAADRAAAALRKADIRSCLINAGGQVFALGTNQGRAWEIGVKGPHGSGVCGRIGLRDQSVSTSADYEQFFESAGCRYGHIMDPRSGVPANSGMLSATVIAGDGLTADALSTAAIVLGREKAKELIAHYRGVTGYGF
jgi:FAD:protein FMN transferase